MQLINILLAAVLATTALASPKIRFVPHTLKAHCNGNDNDCCFNNSAGCRNQRGSFLKCDDNENLCKNFKTDKDHGEVTPSYDGADCCVISTGYGGSCHR
ncbi:hypothetical protein EG328_002992 [Venturia inaequalis]|uniref:Uncharacterized protein n=1 Tax=Venturia inaequalis TaxID=5025 RepID=A0A8H3USX9_VENIN|nr:hypothetical protein EG328_002992 [Venturia inaequalis]KAE9991246.1 hypothetical protein EG327_000248 [Venturia inaequalis]